ncbi:hypothetical protein HG536_0C06160 [Torulaspora globosa]|uniref:allantoicase n=1 Tax=Torulaspora globosa TaxID=48254 RepID=A0A7G3ZG11_9SACH|nr:uncharacterized protein HG536_0C06160 [Torulaspora globosa]QLL32447.1 hypothetical protein HG536_0C06160 [Torulaspora globosa]
MSSVVLCSSETEFARTVASEYHCVDVIGAKLGGRVVCCSDEWFAAAENLIQPRAPVRDATRFTHAGAWYDGWETRRHNENAYDWVILRMGVAAAHVVGGEVDTAFFDGNHAPYVAVEALYDEQAEDVAEDDARWVTVADKFACGPSQRHFFLRKAGLTGDKFTHVKLKMYPDGGIARFRLYGKVVSPAQAAGDISELLDLASVCNGAVAIAVSDQHYGSADNLLLPGRGHDMSDGWETKRSREPGHVDWVIVQLGRRTRYLDRVVVDTAHFRGNFPQYVRVEGSNGLGAEWIELVGKSKTGPDKEHEFEVKRDVELTHLKLTIIPDGGVKRIRAWGR